MVRSTSEQRTVVPVPDPTTLTTQQLIRELSAVRELLETRLDGMDKALMLLQARADKVPSEMDVALTRFHEIISGKFEAITFQFSSIDTRFSERDHQRSQYMQDSRNSVDAALQAQKEAVSKQNESNALAIAKSEAFFIKQIDQLSTIITTMAKGMDDKISDVKDRLTSAEGLKKGATDVWAYLIAIGSIALAVVSLFIKR